MTPASEVRPLVGRGGPARLRGAGQGGQLPGRGERVRRHRPGQLPDRLAAVLPQEWDHDAERRRKAHAPEAVGHRPTWQLALDMLDELGDWAWRRRWCRPTLPMERSASSAWPGGARARRRGAGPSTI